MTTNALSLSNIDLNFEDAKQKLISYLQTQDSWKNALTSTTGNALISIDSYNRVATLFAIDAALREAFPDTARSSKSILAIAKSIWALHIIRKKASSVVCNLTNASTSGILIPKYSQFNIASYDFFNRTPIQVAAGATVSVTLYQGTVTAEQKVFGGTINEKVYLGTSANGFSISDDDIYCLINGTEEYTKTTDGLFESGATSLPIFFENTLPTGEIEVTFGDGLYGKLPSINDTLTFIYTITQGKALNNIVTVGEQVVYNSDNNITGITTSESNNGDDEKDAEYYRVNGAYLRSAKIRGGGTTRTQYRALGLGYPGVIDCIFLGQAETFPGNKNYMNVVTAILLTDPVFTTQQFNDFVTYIQTQTIEGLQFIRQDPTTVQSNISVDIYCLSSANPNTVQNSVLVALQQLQTLTAGMLGFSYYRSDLEKIIRNAVNSTDIDYFVLNVPTVDLIAEKYQYVKFNTITVNAYYSTRELVLPSQITI